MNYLIIGINIAVFAFLQTRHARGGIHVDPMEPYYLYPHDTKVYQFVTSAFLHADWMHLLGNMLFLYVFGNHVEDRMGKIGYLAFYLSGAVLAGLGHCLMDDAPVLGASGAVCAVTGAYLALFPLSNVTIFYWVFIMVGTFELAGFWLIGVQIGENLLYHITTARGGATVAYVAHLAGYAAGFLVGMGLLWTRLLSREPYDLSALIERYRRRRQLAALVRNGYQPWTGGSPHSEPATAPAAGQSGAPVSARDAQIMDYRQQILRLISEHDLAGASAAYARLLELDPQQVLNQQAQLDLANHFMAAGQHQLAARAYELFLTTYSGYAQREQIQLILGLVYARYLGQRQRAAELLAAALPRLTDSAQQALAREELRR